MFKYIQIAWRNLWRNKRRTLITSASLFFGIFFSVMMSSIQKGSFENMIGNMARFYTGYIQIQNKEFKESPGVNNSFILDNQTKELIASADYITSHTNRVETFAIASHANHTFPSIVFGINPGDEDRKSGLSKFVKDGDYLRDGSNDILLGDVLAENLNVKTGDSIVIYGQGYHGVTAVGLYRVAGLLKFPLPELSKRIVYMDLSNCQEFSSMPNRITSSVIMLEKTDDVDAVMSTFSGIEDENVKVYDWKELMPEILNLIEGKESSAAMMKTLLFMIIGFGVWSTIIMLMNERKRELAVMISIGFKKGRLLFMILVESFFIGIIGIVSGLLVSYPIFYYFYKNPIIVTGKMAETYESMGFEPKIAFSISPEIFITPALIVMAIFMVVSLYQVYYIAKFNLVKSLKS
jgi:ABC-type lipoprotein release transport system permease subunit